MVHQAKLKKNNVMFMCARREKRAENVGNRV